MDINNTYILKSPAGGGEEIVGGSWHVSRKSPFIDSPKSVLYMLTGLTSCPAPTEKWLMKVLQLVKG